MKVYGVSGNTDVDLLFLGILSASRPSRLTPGNDSLVPIGQQTGRTPEPIWMIGEVRIFDPTGPRTP
jgi:hypothetical protein